jgi:hypothetical protein
MMRLQPEIFNGLRFNGVDAVASNLAGGFKGGLQNNLNKVDLGFVRKPYDVPNVFQYPIDYSTRRGVVSCKVINLLAIRKGKGSQMTGYIAPEGIARGQQKGLAYNSNHPLNAPILKMTNSFFPNQLGIQG